MENFSININAMAYKGAGKAYLKNQRGQLVKCLVIPVEENCLHETDRGTYLSFIAWRNGKLKDGKTHLVKQSLPKEKREAMSEQQLHDLPIFGDVRPLTPQARQAVKCEEYAAAGDEPRLFGHSRDGYAPANAEAGNDNGFDFNEDDLPF